jgi:DNA-binding MarR family transcriptional regulator
MRSDTATKARPKRADDSILPLAQSLRLAVMRLARRLRQQSEPDLTPSMLSALSTIERHGPMTLRELAAHERVQPPTVTATLGRLESAGLTSRDTDLDDRRVSWVSLTPEGRRLVEANRSRKTEFLAKRLSRLDPAEREILARALPIIERLIEGDR